MAELCAAPESFTILAETFRLITVFSHFSLVLLLFATSFTFCCFVPKILPQNHKNAEKKNKNQQNNAADLYTHLVSLPHSFLYICACSLCPSSDTEIIFLSLAEPQSTHPNEGSQHIISIINLFSTKGRTPPLLHAGELRERRTKQAAATSQTMQSPLITQEYASRWPWMPFLEHGDGVLTMTGDLPSALSGNAEDERSHRP